MISGHDYAKPSLYALQKKRKKRIRGLALFAAILSLPIISADIVSRFSHHASNDSLYAFHALIPNLDNTLNTTWVLGTPIKTAQKKSPEKQFYLQVGTFIDMSKAKQAEDMLAAYANKLRIVPLSREHPELARVLIGPYKSYQATKKPQAELSQRHLATLVVSKESSAH